MTRGGLRARDINVMSKCFGLADTYKTPLHPQFFIPCVSVSLFISKIQNMESIKKARKICSITQTEFAKRLNVDQSNYSNIENGKLILNTIPTLRKVAISILVPELDYIIALKAKELSDIQMLRESLYNER